MLILIIIGSAILFILFMAILSEGLVHIDLTINDKPFKYARGNVFTFFKMFKKYKEELVFDKNWKNSLFSKTEFSKHYLHASIYRFNYINMKLDLVSATIVEFWMMFNPIKKAYMKENKEIMDHIKNYKWE